MTKNILVSLEGLDGSGKTSVAEKLARLLTESGRRVMPLREPGGTDISYEIRRTLLEFKNVNMSPRAEVLLFNAARAQLVDERIKPFLLDGEDGIVLMDRFYDSTLAYQGYGRGESLGELNMIISYATLSLTPDLTFFLSISPADALKRKGEAKNRLDREDISFYERVKTGYETLGSLYTDRWRIVDATKPIDVVSESIFQEIINYTTSF